MKTRSLIRIILALLIPLWSAVATASAEAGTAIYVTGSGNEFGTIDPTTRFLHIDRHPGTPHQLRNFRDGVRIRR